MTAKRRAGLLGDSAEGGPAESQGTHVSSCCAKKALVASSMWAWDVQLDGMPMHRPQDRHLRLRRSSNRSSMNLGATEAAFPGVTRHEITAQAGQTHFFVARTSQRKNAMIAAAGATGGGLLGLALAPLLPRAMTIPGRSTFFRSTRRPPEQPLRSLSWPNRPPTGMICRYAGESDAPIAVAMTAMSCPEISNSRLPGIRRNT